MILGKAKNAQSGRACAPGGSASRGLATPRRKDGLCSFCLAIGQEAPCGPSDRFRVLQNDGDAKAAQDGVDQARRGRVIHKDPGKRPVERDSSFPGLGGAETAQGVSASRTEAARERF